MKKNIENLLFALNENATLTLNQNKSMLMLSNGSDNFGINILQSNDFHNKVKIQFCWKEGSNRTDKSVFIDEAEIKDFLLFAHHSLERQENNNIIAEYGDILFNSLKNEVLHCLNEKESNKFVFSEKVNNPHGGFTVDMENKENNAVSYIQVNDHECINNINPLKIQLNTLIKNGKVLTSRVIIISIPKQDIEKYSLLKHLTFKEGTTLEVIDTLFANNKIINSKFLDCFKFETELVDKEEQKVINKI